MLEVMILVDQSKSDQIKPMSSKLTSSTKNTLITLQDFWLSTLNKSVSHTSANGAIESG